MIERQELFCHDCQKYVQFDIDLELDGNHVFKCPNCEHEHCRVVKDGKITDIRWSQRNGPVVQVNQYTMTSTSASTYTVYTSGSTHTSTGNSFAYQSWMNSTTTV